MVVVRLGLSRRPAVSSSPTLSAGVCDSERWLLGGQWQVTVGAGRSCRVSEEAVAGAIEASQRSEVPAA